MKTAAVMKTDCVTKAIAQRLHRIDVLTDAVEMALHDAESRLYMLPVNAEQIERDILTAQIGIYRKALSASKENRP